MTPLKYSPPRTLCRDDIAIYVSCCGDEDDVIKQETPATIECTGFEEIFSRVRQIWTNVRLIVGDKKIGGGRPIGSEEAEYGWGIQHILRICRVGYIMRQFT